MSNKRARPASKLLPTIEAMRLDQRDNLSAYLQKLRTVAEHTPGARLSEEIQRVEGALNLLAELQEAKNVFRIDEIRFAKGVRQ